MLQKILCKVSHVKKLLDEMYLYLMFICEKVLIGEHILQTL